MRKRVIVWSVLATILLGVSTSATTIGFALGFDPTGLLLVSALTETAITDSLELRAEAGIATSEVAGLMVATGSILYHYPIPPIDPFVGIGVGAALTPPPFSTGVVLEGIAGVRVVPFEPVSFFGQIRYLVRWSGEGVSTGPIYEAGVQLRF
ncbi:MAG: hypothetical protein WBC63_09305 [Candidatus Bipolaricaulia bacterium]